MSDPNYPDDIRQYDSDPRSPFYNDPTESVAFEEEKEVIYRERVSDINGYIIESIGESSDEWLRELSNLVLLWGDSPSDKVNDVEIRIGKMVARRIDEYCTPDDDAVLDSLNKDD